MSKRPPTPQADTWSVVLSSSSATESLGRRIGQSLEGGTVVALIGELGAGKTTLVRGIAAGLGMPVSEISSPTFVLIHEYQGRLPLVHVDLYRLQYESEASAIGLSDYFTDTSAVVIEWADRFPALLPEDRLEIALGHRSPDVRSAQLCAKGPRSMSLLSRLKRSWPSTRRSAGPRRAIKRSRMIREART